MIIITGSPELDLSQSVAQNVKNAGMLVCYTVIGKGKKPSPKVENDIRIAKSKGIRVHLLEHHRFSEAFKKVGGI